MKFLKQSTDVRYVIEKPLKLTFFLVSQFLSFRHTKQNSKNVADKAFKQRCFLAASVYSAIAHSLYSSCFKNYSLLKSVEILIMLELGLFFCTSGLVEIYGVRITFRKYLSGISFFRKHQILFSISLIAIRLPHDQLWTILKGVASPTQC